MPRKSDFDKKEPNCAEIAFIQRDAAGGSKLIEQTLLNMLLVLLRGAASALYRIPKVAKVNLMFGLEQINSGCG